MATPAPGIHIFCCINQREEGSPLPCCANRGGAELLTAFQSELMRRRYPRGIKVSGSTCLTTCQCGPTVAVYPEGVWYGNVTPADVPELMEAHLSGSGPVTRLLVPTAVKVW